jgi:hypothetical protein
LHSAELKLTTLLSDLFDYLEAQSPQVLMHNNISFRGALERYFFFEVQARPESLKPLLKLTKNWRKDQGTDSEMAECFDSYVEKAQNRTLFSLVRASLLPWLRISKDVLSVMLSNGMIKSGTNKTRQYGFFAINQRFLAFFEPIADVLGHENSVFFTSPAFQNNKKNTLTGGSWSALFSARKVRLKLRLWHPLFPYLYRQTFFFNYIHGALSKQSPSVLIFAEGTSHYDYLSALAAKALSIPTVRIQSGRAGILHSGYRNMNFDTMLCWSEDFVERYRQVSPSPKYKVVGSPTVDEFVQLKQATNNDYRKILFITQPVSRYISKADYQLLIDVARELLITSAECSLIIRHHPVDTHEGFDKLSDLFPGRIKKMNSPDYSLAKTLTESACAVGFFSTAISEAAACGVIPIIVQTRESQSVYPFPEKHNSAIVTSNGKEATQEVLNVLEKPQEYEAMKEAMKQFSYRFFGPADGKSMQRTVAEIERLARETGEQGIG